MDLTRFVNTYRGPLIGLIASWGAPWTDAAEIAQDSFVEAWLKRHYCRGDWTTPEVSADGCAESLTTSIATGRGVAAALNRGPRRSTPTIPGTTTQHSIKTF